MTKKPATYDEQLKKLKDRGCIIENESICKQTLAKINYYRLSAYFLPFKLHNGHYRNGTSFNNVYRIYEFDRKLRGLLFAAIEEVEISLRSQIAYFHSHKYGELGYKDATNFSRADWHQRLCDDLKREISHNSSVLFVKHHNQKYGGDFPLWVATELFTFGMLSRLYSIFHVSDQKAFASVIGLHYRLAGSWLRCCTDLRNICAHYGRLYFRVFPAIPAGLPSIVNVKRKVIQKINEK